MNKTIHPIAHIRSDYRTKFGIPRQFGLVDQEARIVFEPEYDNPDCFKELEGFSHLWLIWGFSANEDAGWSPTVRPPRLGGNRRVGVFASRSPFRPNGLGLSAVRLVRIEIDSERSGKASGGFDGSCKTYAGSGKSSGGCRISLVISGADLMDGTPIYDIKPYIPGSDAIIEAAGGFAAKAKDKHLDICCDENLLSRIPIEKRDPLLKSLSYDPRPSYQNDPERIYGMLYADYDIRFTVSGQELTIIDIIPHPETD